MAKGVDAFHREVRTPPFLEPKLLQNAKEVLFHERAEGGDFSLGYPAHARAHLGDPEGVTIEADRLHAHSEAPGEFVVREEGIFLEKAYELRPPLLAAGSPPAHLRPNGRRVLRGFSRFFPSPARADGISTR